MGRFIICMTGSICGTFAALLHKSLIMNGAGEGNRTLVSGLGSPHSTIEPHPHRLAADRKPATQQVFTRLPRGWQLVCEPVVGIL
jgi:hypothetical protein